MYVTASVSSVSRTTVKLSRIDPVDPHRPAKASFIGLSVRQDHYKTISVSSYPSIVTNAGVHAISSRNTGERFTLRCC